MKLKNRFSVLLLFACLFAACKGKDEDVKPAINQYFTVKVNGKDFVYSDHLTANATFNPDQSDDSLALLLFRSWVKDITPIEELDITMVNVKNRLNKG
jgi:hypothetical protein